MSEQTITRMSSRGLSEQVPPYSIVITAEPVEPIYIQNARPVTTVNSSNCGGGGNSCAAGGVGASVDENIIDDYHFYRCNCC